MMVMIVLRMETLLCMETRGMVIRVKDMVVVEDLISMAVMVSMNIIVGQAMVKDIMVDKHIPLIMDL